MEKTSKIYVAGHTGLVGGAILRGLRQHGYSNIVVRTHKELDLLNQAETNRFFEQEKPEYVFLAAARVGGIVANSQNPANFIYENMTIGFNVVHAAYKNAVKKLMNLGTTCIYPKMALQPIKEEYLLTGPLEATNDAYALAKISVIKLCRAYNEQYGANFLSVMPCSLYGPGDSYDLTNSHVLPAFIRKFHEAKMGGSDRVVLWGDGSPFREFLYSDDIAEAVIFLMEKYNAIDLRTPVGDFINIGSGADITIKELAETVRDIVYADANGRDCVIEWDTTKPNGTFRKVTDITRLKALDFQVKTDFRASIALTYKDFIERFGHHEI
jgi:GDP-L-fucose synthase